MGTCAHTHLLVCGDRSHKGTLFFLVDLMPPFPESSAQEKTKEKEEIKAAVEGGGMVDHHRDQVKEQKPQFKSCIQEKPEKRGIPTQIQQDGKCMDICVLT